jgi:KDO2-lipid IV(A) lauroyltransferase
VDTNLRHRAEHGLVVAVSSLARAVPWAVAMRLAAGLGTLVYAVDHRHRRLAIANLSRAFPAWSRRECASVARRVFVHFAELLVEMFRFRGATVDEIRGRVELVGAERIHQAHREGRGALLITGHFGFWELHALAHGALLYPMAVVARPLDNPHLHDMLEEVRTATGNTVIYRKGGLRRILKTLLSNQAVAVLIDQHIQPADALIVEYFGRPAATTAAVAALAARTGAPVIPCFALPVGGGRYRLTYEPPVDPPAGESADELRAFTQRCTDVLEMYVRRYPDRWLWMHRRWRVEEDAS